MASDLNIQRIWPHPPTLHIWPSSFTVPDIIHSKYLTSSPTLYLMASTLCRWAHPLRVSDLIFLQYITSSLYLFLSSHSIWPHLPTVLTTYPNNLMSSTPSSNLILSQHLTSSSHSVWHHPPIVSDFIPPQYLTPSTLLSNLILAQCLTSSSTVPDVIHSKYITSSSYSFWPYPLTESDLILPEALHPLGVGGGILWLIHGKEVANPQPHLCI